MPPWELFLFKLPKVPFPGFLSHSDSVGYWPVSSSWMKPCNLESLFFNISIMKNLTDFRKLVETSVDLSLCHYSRKYGILIVFQ